MHSASREYKINDERHYIIDTRTSSEMKGHTGDVSYIKWDPTHPERLVSCSATAGSAGMDRGLYFWDIRQGKPTSIIQTHGENINLAWSPDGKTIVVGTRNDVVSYIDVAAGKVVREDKNKQEVASPSIHLKAQDVLTCYYDRRMNSSSRMLEHRYSLRSTPMY